MLAPWRKSYDIPKQILKSRDITLLTKVYIVKAMVFPVVMYGCVSWTVKAAEHWAIDVFELWCWRRLFKSPLDSKDIKPVNPKGNQPCIFIGRTVAEVEPPILWPPDAGKDWGQEEKGVTEDRIVGWHHRLNRHEFEQTLRNNEGLLSLACCSPWSCKESDIAELLNNHNLSSSVNGNWGLEN